MPSAQGNQDLLADAEERFSPELTTPGQSHSMVNQETTFNESRAGQVSSTTYYDDDFTTFLDSIPLPSHPYSPTYQPLPLFPAFQFDSTPVYQDHWDKDTSTHNVPTPSSSILPRHGTQLPSLQPEESHPPFKARQLGALITVSTQCRENIMNQLAGYSNVLQDPFIPSRHALSRCLTGYLTGFHEHYPFMHIPTLDVDSLPPHLFLSMAALGAQYCREPEISRSLYKVGKAVTLEHIRREFHQDGIAHPGNRTWQDRQDENLLKTLQALLILNSIACWSKDDPPHQEALYMRSHMGTLLRQGDFNALPFQDGSWEAWVKSEEVKRTKLIIFCFFSIHTIVFDLPPMILTEEITMDLPCTEKEWTATSANHWLDQRRLSGEEPKLQDALGSLFTPHTANKTRLESFSSLGGYVLIHAIIQNIWMIQKANRLPHSNNTVLSSPVITSLEQALEHWCQCWEHNRESSIEPFNPNGPLSFTSTALLRLAYIRLNADFSSTRQLQSWKPQAIAQSLRDNISVRRSDRLTRAALHCAHALVTPIKLGINYVSRTLVVSWSNQYALCSLECAVLLAKWLEAATVFDPQPGLTEQESKLLEFVIEMAMEAQPGVSREWLLSNNTRLSAAVTRLWARLFTADYIWQLVYLIGQSLNEYADLLER